MTTEALSAALGATDRGAASAPVPVGSLAAMRTAETLVRPGDR